MKTKVLLGTLFLLSLYIEASSSSVVDVWNSMPKTKREVTKKYKPVYSPELDSRFQTAQLNVKMRKAKMGLIHRTVSGVDESLDGFEGYLLGIAYGLQFDKNSAGVCYTSLESIISVATEIYSYMAEIYKPVNWANLLVAFQDVINISATIYAYCYLQNLYNTIAALISQEGLVEFICRSATSLLFEQNSLLTSLQSCEYDFCRGQYGAVMFSRITNFQIY